MTWTRTFTDLFTPAGTRISVPRSVTLMAGQKAGPER